MQFHLISVATERKLNFLGNLSVVILLDSEFDEKKMQRIALDMHQPATSFLWPSDKENTFQVRWFAPDAEIGLCGHGSLAAAAFCYEVLDKHQINLQYKHGQIALEVDQDKRISMLMDCIKITEEIGMSEVVSKGLGFNHYRHFKTENKDIILVEQEMDVANMKVKNDVLRQSDIFGYIVTAPSQEVDFVSRTIVPHVQQLEDHATGSSHAALFPFWSKRLSKTHLTAKQLSPRGGYFTAEIKKQNQLSIKAFYDYLAHGEYFLNDA